MHRLNHNCSSYSLNFVVTLTLAYFSFYHHVHYNPICRHTFLEEETENDEVYRSPRKMVPTV